jgi:hypothetical protein
VTEEPLTGSTRTYLNFPVGSAKSSSTADADREPKFLVQPFQSNPQSHISLAGLFFSVALLLFAFAFAIAILFLVIQSSV